MNMNFLSGSYSARSIAVDGQETVNWFPEITDDPSKSGDVKIALYPTEGLKLFMAVKDADN